MTRRFVPIGLIDLPAWTSLAAKLQHDIAAAQQTLDCVDGSAWRDVRQWMLATPLSTVPLLQGSDELRHRLSDRYAETMSSTSEGRGRAEQDVLLTVESEAPSFASMESLAVRVASLFAHGGAVGLRAGPVITKPDRNGVSIAYPPPELVRPWLAALDRFLAKNSGAPALYRACYAMLAIFNCHPFVDGNGRVGRTAFHLLLRQAAAERDLYLPLYDFCRISQGGFILRVREAQRLGRVEGLFWFFGELARRIQLRDYPSRSPSRSDGIGAT